MLPDPVNKTLTDFTSLATSDPSNYHDITSNPNLTPGNYPSLFGTGSDGKPYLKPGVYYVNNANGSTFNFSLGLSTSTPSNITFVTSGAININSPSFNFTTYSQGILIFANTGSDVTGGTTSVGVNFSGGNTSSSWHGIAYAPYSKLQVSHASGIRASGSLVADTIQVTNSENITADSSLFGPPQAEIVLYE